MVKHFWVENCPGPRLVSAAGLGKLLGRHLKTSRIAQRRAGRVAARLRQLCSLCGQSLSAFGVEMGNGIQHRAFLLWDFVLRAPGEELSCPRITGWEMVGMGARRVMPAGFSVGFWDLHLGMASLGCSLIPKLSLLLLFRAPGLQPALPGRWRRRSPALRNEDLTRGGGGEFLAGEQQGRELLEELAGFR